MQNITELGATENFQGKVYRRLDKLGGLVKTAVKQKEEEDFDNPENKKEAEMEIQIPSPPCSPKLPWVFLSHSKNKKILDQIKQVLAYGQFQFEIAEERETLSMPLSDKVFGLMKKCNCAIINITQVLPISLLMHFPSKLIGIKHEKSRV